MKVPVVQNVMKLNDEVAAMNRRQFREAHVHVLNLIGSPGCGKTALLEATLRALQGERRIGVLVGDLASSRDGERLAALSDNVVQINTGRGCHLDANQVRHGITRLDLESLDILFIENVGNLICPVGFDLGEDAKVGMFGVSEGDDKAIKHPYLVLESSLILLNKIDLLPHVDFDIDRFRDDVTSLNPAVGLLELSVRQHNVNHWVAWLLERCPAGTRPGRRRAARMRRR